MRHKNFRFTAFCSAAVMAAALTIAGTPAVWAEETAKEDEAVVTEDAAADEAAEDFDESEADVEGTEESDTDEAAAELPEEPVDEIELITQYLEGSIDDSLTNVIISMSDEDIEMYSQNAEGFSKTAPEAWKAVKDELGERKDDTKTLTVVKDGETYIVTENVPFEKMDADFVYIFDETLTPTDLSINVNYPMSVNLQRAGLNTLMGLATVFIMLIFLSFVISLFKYIPTGKKKAEKEEASPASAPVSAPEPEPEYDEADDQELVAVIAAAIAASEGTTPDGFVVRSIRKSSRGRR